MLQAWAPKKKGAPAYPPADTHANGLYETGYSRHSFYQYKVECQ